MNYNALQPAEGRESSARKKSYLKKFTLNFCLLCCTHTHTHKKKKGKRRENLSSLTLVLGRKKMDFSLLTGMWLAEVKASFLMVMPLCSTMTWKNIVRDKAGLSCSPRTFRAVEKTKYECLWSFHWYKQAQSYQSQTEQFYSNITAQWIFSF